MRAEAEERVGRLLKGRDDYEGTGHILRIDTVLEPGVVLLVTGVENPHFQCDGAVYKRVPQTESYAMATQRSDDSWIFTFPSRIKPTEKQPQPLGDLIFAPDVERRLQQRAEKQKKRCADVARRLQLWMPALSDAGADRLSKKPRLQKLPHDIADAEQFVEWLLQAPTDSS